YPRWRGEHCRRRNGKRCLRGLSPLARGTQEERNFATVYGGLSRWRGEHYRAGMVSRAAPVYPRWRGEHERAWLQVGWEAGLSPLARGTRLRQSRSQCIRRFIPAGAGNTRFHQTMKKPPPVYPRWR
ncbi:hypothetical protein SEEM41H_16324, partial [Salmonella enterica subsp. enterica serovar Montevideo str. 4441 H]